MGGTVYHASGTAGGTETPAFAAEGNKFLVMAGVATNTQEATFQTATLQVVIEALLRLYYARKERRLHFSSNDFHLVE